MSTGSVNPFTPAGATVVLVVGTTSATVTFGPADAVLLLNTGTVPVFVTFGTAGQTITALTAGSTPVPAGGSLLLGTPGVSGASPITTLAAVVASGTATLYITPGQGTQH